MYRPPIATTTWVAEQIKQMKEVTDAEVTGPYTFRVDRPDLPSFGVLVFSSASVTDGVLGPLLSSFPDVSFAVNVPKNSKWVKSGIAMVTERNVAFGGMGDLMSAIGHKLQDIRQFKKKENEFVERILKQHTGVSSIEQEADRVYQIFRTNGVPLRVVLLNEYELTGDRVRAAVDEYGAFDIVLMTNPSGSATTDARDVSKALKIPLLTSRQLLGRLNVP
jgi:hypothetical protein